MRDQDSTSVTNTCPFHPEALPGERTVLGRMGCGPCAIDPWNLDPLVEDIIDVDAGQTRCPTCSSVVEIRLQRGQLVAFEEGGGITHQHPANLSAPQPASPPVWEREAL